MTTVNPRFEAAGQELEPLSVPDGAIGALETYIREHPHVVDNERPAMNWVD